jgi:hypothetical protein
MILKHLFKVSGLLTAILLAGCASFEPGLRYQDLSRPRQPTVKETQEGLELSIEEFASKNKSQQAFDADIALYGILALLFKAENGGTKTYGIQEQTISVYLGNESVPSISGERAASQGANSEYVGKALGWTALAGPFAIVLWPATIIGSGAHTASVNRRIEQHFESMRFSDAVLKPNQSAAGFLYFKLPAGVKKLENLRVEATPSEEATGDRLSYKLLLPTLDLSGAVAAPPTSQSSGSQP